jgi:SAM-dependent methyltransferase
MRRDEVLALYDADYAGAYDQRFLLADHSAPNARRELELIAGLLAADGASWLDVGCGTGWFLAQFPGVKRAGLDLSAAMLELARERSPEADFRQGDFREPVPEWRGAWSLVSCMWAAYAYVDAIGEVETLVANMREWTAPGGSMLIPIIDLPDLRNFDVTYRESTYFSGEVWVNGVIWSWTDEISGKLHRNLLAPHTDQFIEWLAPWFEEIRVVPYPCILEGVVSRKAVLALGRREVADGRRTRVVREAEEARPASNAAPAPLAAFTAESLAAELVRRLRPGRVWRGALTRLRRAPS